MPLSTHCCIENAARDEVINHGVQDSSAPVVQRRAVDHFRLLPIARPRPAVARLHPHNIPVVKCWIRTGVIGELPGIVNEIPRGIRFRQTTVQRKRCDPQHKPKQSDQASQRTQNATWHSECIARNAAPADAIHPPRPSRAFARARQSCALRHHALPSPKKSHFLSPLPTPRAK